MAALEKYTIRELERLISEGKTYRLFKPFYSNGQILLNVEKVLTEKDLRRLEGKLFGPVEVVPAVEHKTDSNVRNILVENCIKILKNAPLFNSGSSHHLDFTKRKETEKLFDAIIKGNPHLAEKLIEIYKFSKKLFIHTINVGIMATVIDLGVQQKQKIHNALRSEELLTGALLHEVGFLNLPKSLIEKKRHDYTEEEKQLYKTYPAESKKIAENLGDNIRKKTLEIIEQHQERRLGNGFPNKLKGNQIEPLALIVGLACEFDLINSKEIAKHNKPPSEIMSRISRSSKFFGSDIVDSFYTWFRYLK